MEDRKVLDSLGNQKVTNTDFSSYFKNITDVIKHMATDVQRIAEIWDTYF